MVILIQMRMYVIRWCHHLRMFVILIYSRTGAWRMILGGSRMSWILIGWLKIQSMILCWYRKLLTTRMSAIALVKVTGSNYVADFITSNRTDNTAERVHNMRLGWMAYKLSSKRLSQYIGTCTHECCTWNKCILWPYIVTNHLNIIVTYGSLESSSWHRWRSRCLAACLLLQQLLSLTIHRWPVCAPVDSMKQRH